MSSHWCLEPIESTPLVHPATSGCWTTIKLPLQVCWTVVNMFQCYAQRLLGYMILPPSQQPETAKMARRCHKPVKNKIYVSQANLYTCSWLCTFKTLPLDALTVNHLLTDFWKKSVGKYGLLSPCIWRSNLCTIQANQVTVKFSLSLALSLQFQVQNLLQIKLWLLICPSYLGVQWWRTWQLARQIRGVNFFIFLRQTAKSRRQSIETKEKTPGSNLTDGMTRCLISFPFCMSNVGCTVSNSIYQGDATKTGSWSTRRLPSTL